MDHNYISNFKDFSTEYYNIFKESDFPKKLEFTEPFKLSFEYHHLIPGSNKIFLKYLLSSDQPQPDNPYSGDMPEEMTMDIGITYKDDGTTKMYVIIVGGNREWWGFTYENKTIKDFESTEYKMSKKSLDKLIKALNKYSI